MANQSQLIGALTVSRDLARTVGLKRALFEVDPNPVLNFWRVISGGTLDMAVLDWCKLFGSDNSDLQQVHWKNVFTDEVVFREGLLAYVGLNQEDWRLYQQNMKFYRDKYTAHLDLANQGLARYPDLDIALKSASYYYGRIIRELRLLGETRYPDDLLAYYEKFKAQATEIAEIAMASTRNFPERAR